MTDIAIYRIVKKKWADSAFDGEGARLYGGRWNNKGKSCVYTASSESLAILEILAHLHSNSLLNSYCLIKSQVPESDVMELATLPTNWRSEPAPPDTAKIGDQWLAGSHSLSLKVPSVIVPREFNYLINPHHPNMNKILEQAERIELDIDPRLI